MWSRLIQEVTAMGHLFAPAHFWTMTVATEVQLLGIHRDVVNCRLLVALHHLAGLSWQIGNTALRVSQIY